MSASSETVVYLAEDIIEKAEELYGSILNFRTYTGNPFHFETQNSHESMMAYSWCMSESDSLINLISAMRELKNKCESEGL